MDLPRGMTNSPFHGAACILSPPIRSQRKQLNLKAIVIICLIQWDVLKHFSMEALQKCSILTDHALPSDVEQWIKQH